jgi:outer membrane protein W
MKNIITVILAVSAFILSLAANAQKGTLQLNLSYNYSMPAGAFKSDLVNDNSPRGGRGSIMYSFSNRLSAGLESGYQDYYQKYSRELYALPGSQDVSAVLSNSIQTTPVLLKAQYFLLPTAAVKPYVSVGAGANLVNFRQYLGEFGSSSASVAFLAHGGAGVMVPFSQRRTTGVTIGASYEYAPYNKNGYHNLNTINLHAGVVFPLR